MEAEIEVLDLLAKYARALAQTKNPKKRIVASRWEIQFAEKLEAAKESEVTA